jgi:uncharacterized protein (TIGR02145 family)
MKEVNTKDTQIYNWKLAFKISRRLFPGNFILFFVALSVIILIYYQSFAIEKGKEIKIGHQIWMGDNLNVDRFSNGDFILQVNSNLEWKTAANKKIPAWCYYKFSKSNARYGKLYNWYAMNDRRGLAPKGWRVPNKNDWQLVLKELKLSVSSNNFKESGSKKAQTNIANINDKLFNTLGMLRDYYDSVWMDGFFYWINEDDEILGKNNGNDINQNYGCVLYHHSDFLFGSESKSCMLFIRCIRE